MFVCGADGVPLKPVQWSAEFYAWSALHGMTIDFAVGQAYRTFPSDLILFGEAARDHPRLAREPETERVLPQSG
jgi:hypothetical protein